MQENRPKKIESNIMQSLLSKADPMETCRTKNRMLMAALIQDAMELKKITKKQLAEKLKKSPSIVSRYLSGTQNLTIDTLSDLEYILGVDFMQTEAKEKPTQIECIMVSSQDAIVSPINQFIREKIMA